MAQAERQFLRPNESHNENQPMLEAGAEAKSSKTPCSLTNHQQRLLIMLGLWFCIGLYMYMSRPWGTDGKFYSLDEALYIMVQILTTVGYGDECPAKDGGFIFTSIFVLTAVGVLSSIVSAVTEVVISTQDRLIKDTLGKVDMGELKNHIRDRLSRSNINEDSPKDGQSRVLVPEDGPEIRPKSSTRVGFQASALDMHPSTTGFIRAALIWLVFVIAGVLFYINYPGEEFEVIEAIYMSIITLTTVGFGDMTPRTRGGRIFAIFWMLFGVASFANMVGKFAACSMAQDRIRKLDADTLLDIQADDFYRKNHPPSADGRPPKVTRADFVMFMMKQMGILDESIVETLSQNFDDLDRDGSGYLDTADINSYTERLRTAATRSRS
mmetsp:Transcript_70537/g.206432  ORF Transcript_70537/g.206432 Transcript_70537/m.206432 type:complete len:382 (+) Transcript_70537:143-1288(+)